MREKLWRKFQELKYTELYYIRYKAYVMLLSKLLSAIGLLTSSVSIAGWSIWSQHSMVWGIIIGVSQLIQVFRPLYPFEKQLASLEMAVPAMKKLLVDFSADWNRHGGSANFDAKVGQKLLEKYDKAFLAIDTQFKSEEMTPDLLWLRKKADRDLQNYFFIHHAIKEWKDIDARISS